MKNKPRLVDYSLFVKPKVPVQKPKRIIQPEIKSGDNSFIINLVSILILGIGGLMMYYRLIEKTKKDLDKQTTILNFHSYVTDNIK